MRGLVASISKDNTSTVKLRSGTTLLVDGQDLPTPGAPTTRFGRVRADGTNNGTALSKVLLLANEDIQVFGTLSGTFVVTSDPGSKAGSSGGSIIARSLTATISAAGAAFRAGLPNSQNVGGVIDLAASGAVNLDVTRLDALGDVAGANPKGVGGTIKVRSYQSDVSWTSGVGDVKHARIVKGDAARGNAELRAHLIDPGVIQVLSRDGDRTNAGGRDLAREWEVRRAGATREWPTRFAVGLAGPYDARADGQRSIAASLQVSIPSHQSVLT